MFYKTEVRKALLTKRRNLADVIQVQAAMAVATQVVNLPAFIHSKYIAAYVAVHGELNPFPILHCAESLKKNLYLPVLSPQPDQTTEHMQFHAYRIGDELLAHEYGLAQPNITQTPIIKATELNLIILPLVGFDRSGNRLGRGAGHYDRTLEFIRHTDKKHRPILLGIAYEFQHLDKLHAAPWDIPLDLIVTEQNLYVI